MVTLSQVELFLDGTYEKSEQKSFLFKSRCVCNFLERALSRERFEAELSRVNIHCSRSIQEPNASRNAITPLLEVKIAYDMPPVDSLVEAELQSHYADILLKGLSAARSYMAIPLDFCKEVLRDFESGGYQNRWVQAEKSWSRLGIRSEVVATLTASAFWLDQRVYSGEQLVAEERVWETRPREWLFHDYLGDLVMTRSGSVVYRAKKKVLTEFFPKQSRLDVRSDPD